MIIVVTSPIIAIITIAVNLKGADAEQDCRASNHEKHNRQLGKEEVPFQIRIAENHLNGVILIFAGTKKGSKIKRLAACTSQTTSHISA